MDREKMAWVFILIGGMLEIVWAAALDLSDNFSNIPWVIVFLVGLIMSMYFLSKGLGAGLPMGIAYAVWVGIGAVGVFILGMVAFDEPVELLRIGFVMLIIIGIIGLQLTSPKADK